MANLSQNDLKKGVLKGTDSADVISIDANAVGYMNKKITVKAGNGNDDVDITEHYGKFYVYAGMGSDTLGGFSGENYLYGESGVNTFKFGNNDGNTVINAGKGKAIIDFSSVDEIRDNFFNADTIDNKFKRNGNDLIIKPKNGYSTTVTIKDFYKSSGEFIIKYQISENSTWVDKYYDLRDLRLTTNIEDLKSANYNGGRLAEIINGDDRNNTIKGGDGSDQILGGAGNDKLYGGNGVLDAISGEDGNDVIYGKDKNSSRYTMTILDGGAGNDTIYGGSGNDVISGGTGDNKLYGKQGKNSYVYEGGNDTIYLEKDSETELVLNGYNVVNRIKQGNDVLINLKKGDEEGTILLKNFFKIDNVVDTITAFKNAIPNNDDLIDLFPSNDQYFSVNGKGTIKGTAYNDDIKGSEKADKIYAYAGNDKINPDLGNDKIYAADSYSTILFRNGDGKDTIYGGMSNLSFEDVSLDKLKYERIKDDLIIKYSENDSVTLSEYFTNNKTYVDYIYDKSGIGSELSEILESYNNKLEFDYGDGTVKFYSFPDNEVTKNHIKYSSKLYLDNTYQSQKGNDLVISNFGAKNDKLVIVDYFKNGNDVTIEDSTGVLGTLNDILDYYFKLEMTEQGVPNGDFASLGNYSWKYNGVFTNDNIIFGSGADYIKTSSGHDTVDAGSGNDTVYGGSGNDSITSSSGYNKIYGDAGNDIINAGSDKDTIYGGDGNDTITSNGDSDKIYGGNGNDYIDAGDDFDTIDGGAGNDNIYGGDGNDTIKGGSGNDNIYGGGGVNTMYGGKGDDHIYVESDSLVTDNNLVHGDAGNDIIEVEKGYGNRIYGDAGNDYFTVYADATYNEIYGGKGNDTITVNGLNNEVDAGAGNDVININAHYCEVEAGAGNDIINIKGANIDVEGGAGNDTYNFNGGIADVEDSAGNDKYIVDSLLNPTNKYIIDDSKGKDTLVINYNKDDIELGKFNVQVNSKGKIYDLNDIDVMFKAKDENGSVTIEEYFGSGCIERIETKDGYYVTKSQMQNVAQEVAAWLVENGFDDALECYKSGTDVQQAELSFIYDNINWQM